MAKQPKYNLVGVDGNAHAVMGYVARAMREQKFTKEEIEKYYEDAKSADYDHLLGVSIMMVERCNDIAAGHRDDEVTAEWLMGLRGL